MYIILYYSVLCTILNKNHPQIKVDRTVSHPPLLPDCRASHAAQAGGEYEDRAYHVECMP